MDTQQNGETTIELALVEGLAPGAKLRESHMVQVSALGMVFDDGMSLERWKASLRLIRQVKSMATLYLSDAICFGRKKFGEAVATEAMGQLELGLNEAQQAVAIGTLGRECRRVGLTGEHYYVMARAVLNPEAQGKWADLAVEHDLSAAELAASIEAGEVRKKEGKSRGFVTIEGINTLFSTWWRQVEETPVNEWEDARVRDAWRNLEGATRVGIALAKRMGISVEELGKIGGGM